MGNSVSDKEATRLFNDDGGTHGDTVSDAEAQHLFETSAQPEGGAEGGGGSDSAPSKPIPKAFKFGGPADFLRSAADSAVAGGGAQVAGAMAAGLAPQHEGEAYRDVRNESAKQIAASNETATGKAGQLVGTLAMPIPIKPAVGWLARTLQGAKVGATIGGLGGAFQSKGDLTKLDSENWKRVLADALKGAVPGAIGGGAGGAILSGASPAMSALAEEQALRAAGLRGGIKNSVQKDLGVPNMTEARQIGRAFLDEGLIPPVGSSEAVGRRAAKLEGQSGADIGNVMHEADAATMRTPTQPQWQTRAGRPANTAQPQPGFDYDAMGNAAHDVLDQASAPADILSGQKARGLADALAAQGERTPGSFVGANKAKSDAWRSANFSADPSMSASLYRKAVGAARDDIERQVADALGADRAGDLASANRRFGVSQDALKLAENESTREAAKSGMGPVKEALALLSGSVAGGAAGHPVMGAGAGLAGSLAVKGFDKYGHSSAARLSDFLAKLAAENTGGVVGSKAANALAPYLDLLQEEKK